MPVHCKEKQDDLDTNQLQTIIYPNFKDAVGSLQSINEDKELHWLISSIIMPEFEQLLETLHICANMLLYNSPQHPNAQMHTERGPSIKLPVSSTKLELVKGIIVRDGIYITQLSLHLKDSQFNRHIHRITLDQPILLPQLITLKESIDSAVLMIENFNEDQNHSDLISSFENILKEISIAKRSLQFPIDPALVFPLNKINPTFFRPELPHNLSLDLYVNQAELCIDLKNLHTVTEQPWCQIDPKTGRSYVDKIRDDMKNGKSPTPETTPPLLMSSPSEESTAVATFKALGQLLKPKLDPQEYITKCYTYDKSVVMVNRKIEVSCPDPLLVSTFTKLDSLENIVESFLNNLKVICQKV